MTREKTSRPSWSVPNQYFPDGALLANSSCCACGSCGAIDEPNSAQTIQNKRMTAPMMKAGRRSTSRQDGRSARGGVADRRDEDVGRHRLIPVRSRGFRNVLSRSASSVATM